MRALLADRDAARWTEPTRPLAGRQKQPRSAGDEAVEQAVEEELARDAQRWPFQMVSLIG
jgi:hypothetical protein